MQAQDLISPFAFLQKLAESYRNQEEWSRSERGPQEKGGEPAGLVTPLGWGRPGGELYTLELSRTTRDWYSTDRNLAALRSPSFDRLRTGFAKGGLWVPSFPKGGTGRIFHSLSRSVRMFCGAI
jgi:hypothetical protein